MENSNPYSAPKSKIFANKESGQLFQHKRYVIYNSNENWPSRCIKCNKETDLRKEMTLKSLHPWLSILSLIPMMIVLGFIFTKKFPTSLPLCDKHMKKLKSLLIFQWVSTFIMITLLIGSIMLEMEILLKILIPFLFASVIASLFRKIVHVEKYKDGNLWIKGACDEFRNSLPEFDE